MIGRTIAAMLMVLVSAAGTARADGVWGTGSYEGVLVGVAVVAILAVWAFYAFLKYLLKASAPVEKPPVLATARVHRETSPTK